MASDIEDEMSAAKVFAQAPSRDTQEQMTGAREEVGGFVNAHLPAILFIDEQASKNSDHQPDAELDSDGDEFKQ